MNGGSQLAKTVCHRNADDETAVADDGSLTLILCTYIHMLAFIVVVFCIII